MPTQQLCLFSSLLSEHSFCSSVWSWHCPQSQVWALRSYSVISGTTFVVGIWPQSSQRDIRGSLLGFLKTAFFFFFSWQKEGESQEYQFSSFCFYTEAWMCENVMFGVVAAILGPTAGKPEGKLITVKPELYYWNATLTKWETIYLWAFYYIGIYWWSLLIITFSQVHYLKPKASLRNPGHI